MTSMGLLLAQPRNGRNPLRLEETLSRDRIEVGRTRIYLHEYAAASAAGRRHW